MYKSTLSLHDKNGQRKYLNEVERKQFYECTKNYPDRIRLFCQLLFFTGARIAEIHNLNVENIDFSNKSVVIETLKKRKRGVYREIPLPEFLLEKLKIYIEHRNKENTNTTQLWDYSLRTASRNVKSILQEAGVTGVRSSSKSLRHGYAVVSVKKLVPLNLIQKYLGHASIETSSIYLNILGEEEREIVRKIWMV